MRHQGMKKRLAATLAMAVAVGSTLSFNYINTYAHEELVKQNIVSTVATGGAVVPEKEITSISEIRERVSSGTKGENVTFQGVVTRVNASSMYVQDGTVGIYVYGSRKGDYVNPGDKVEIEATTDAYNSLVQVKSAKVTKLETVEQIAPIEVTVAQYLANPENYESVLIKFKDVVLGKINTSGNTSLTDATGSIDIYKIASDVKEGFETYDVTAFGARYGNTRQLTVVSPDDVKPTKGMGSISDLVITKGETFTLPKVEVVRDGEVVECEINWNEEEVVAVDTNKVGNYKVTGELDGVKFTCTVIVTSEEGIKISDIQGASHTSVFENKTVSDIRGVVTVKNGTSGFYIESLEEDRDDDDATSEGIYVSASSTNAKKVKVGDIVEVTGKVEEKQSDAAQLSVTQIYSSVVNLTGENVLEEGGELPAPVVIGDEGRIPPNKIIDNDSFTKFDPEEDSIDFFESLEGMRVQINGAQVVGSTAYELTVVPDEGKHSANGLSAQGGVVITEDNLHPEIITLANGAESVRTDLNVGDQFTDSVVGVMSYTGSVYKVLVSEELPEVQRASYDMSPVTSLNETEDGLRIASFNVENLGGTESQSKFDEIGSVIAKNLLFPDIIGLEEIQDNTGATDDAVVEADLVYKRIIEAIKAQPGGENMNYEYIEIAPVNNLDGGAPGGNIRVGMIYRTDRVQLAEGQAGKADEAVSVVKKEDGKVGLSLNPGRIDPNNEVFSNTRKSLAAEFIFNGESVIVIANHFSSKGGDQAAYGSNQPFVLTSEAKRIEQAKVVNNFVKEILAEDKNAKIVVLGDMNDYQFSNPLKALAGEELHNMLYSLEETERFTYNYQGKSQVLDNILVTKYLESATEVEIMHINSICAKTEQLSDHDPIMIRLNMNDVKLPGGSTSSDDDDNISSGSTSTGGQGATSNNNAVAGVTMTTENGKVSVTLSDKLSDVSNDKVQQVVFEAKQDNKYLDKVNVTLEKSLIKALNTQGKELVIKLENANVVVQGELLKAANNVNIDIETTDVTTKAVQEALPTNRNALTGFNLTVKVNGKVVTNAEQAVTMHFEIPSKKVTNPNKLVAYVVNDGKWTYLDGKVVGNEFVTSSVINGQVILAESTQTFTDIQRHWAQEELEILAAKHLVIGTTEEKFSPKAQIKAGDFATLLERLTGKEVSVETEGKALTRAEMAVMLKEAVEVEEAIDTTNLSAFKDLKDVTDAQKEALSYLVSKGILQGQSATKMAPNQILTRAEMATVIARFIK